MKKKIIKNRIVVNGVRIKQIGGNPWEIRADAKDVLVWIKCQKDKAHPSYLITPYDVIHGKRCPLCEGREVIEI